MTAELVFQISNIFALLGWGVLIAAILLKRPWWRGVLAGQFFPLVLAFGYCALIILFWLRTPGGFDTLANVQLLFTSPWAALAGWIHYLAFDLFIGAWITAKVFENGISKLVLIGVLPLTFLFGPIGLFSFYICRLAFERKEQL